MIYLKDGNVPLNFAFDDEIVQEANGTYSLSFKSPVSDNKWQNVTKETFLLADDLHGEQEFFVFDVVKEDGYIEVFAKQVVSLLHYYAMSSVSVDRGTGQTVMSALAASVQRSHPFSFFSDITERHTLNKANTSVMTVLAKDKHSIIGQWGGDLVRDKYQVKLLKNGGSESEALLMYKKNIRSYNEPSSVAKLRTRIHFRRVIKDEETKEEQVFAVTVDSPLINAYSQIYEDTMEVSDEDVKDLASLTAYGKSYFSRTLCDVVESSIEISVENSLDVPIRLFDVVRVFYEPYGVDLRQKITKYVFSPMSKKLKSVGFGKFGQSLGNTVSGMVNDAVAEASNRLSDDFEARLQKEIDNANKHFEAEFEKGKQAIDDGIEVAKAKAEDVKTEITSQINADIRPLADEAKRVADRAVSDLERQGQELERTKTELGTVRRSAESALQAAQGAKREAITASNQQLDEAKRALSSQIQATQGQIADAKRELQVYAQIRQNDVDTRLTTVEELADGTKTRVLELTTTVDQTTGKVQVVERRTKTVEDSLTGLTRQFEAIRVGGRNYFLNSSLSTASPYTKLTIHPDFEKHVKGKSFIISVEVEGTDITGSNRGRFGISLSVRRGNTSVRDYLEVWETGTGTVAKKRLFKAFDWRADWTDLNAGLYIQTDGHLTVGYPMLEISDVPSDYRPAEEDFRSELATYKQGVDQNLAELTRTTQTIGGKVETYKTTFEQTAERFRTSLSVLETYKNDEAVRASRYFEASKTETAKQMTAMRQVISNDYVAKSTYEENSREVIRRFEGLRTGENLLLNSSFETDLDHWTNNGAVLRDGCVVFEGQLNTTKYLYQPITDLVKADAYNQVYTVGVDIKADNIVLGTTNPYLYIYVEGRHSDNQWFGGTYIERPSFSELNNQGWTRLYTTFTLNVSRAAIRYCNIHLYARDFTGTISAKQIMLSRSTIKQEWSPHPKDSEARLASFKQTVEGQFNTVTEVLNDKVSTTTLNQTAKDIKGLVSSLDGQVMKSSQFRVDENGLVLQSGRTFDGTTIASLLTVNDDHIKAITNQMIITPTQQNLVQSAYRESLVVAARDTQVSEWYTFDAKGGDQFYFEAEVTRLDVTGNYDLKAMVTTIYKEGGYDATRVVLAQRTNPHNQKMVCQATVTLPNRPKTIVKFRIGLQEETHASFTRYRVDNLRVYKKTSAALLVDGTITGRHIAAGSIEAGHIKAGSVTAEILAGDSVTAKHLVVNQALIDKLFVNDLMTRTLTARQAFITSVQAIDLSATRIKSGILASRSGAVLWDLDRNKLQLANGADIEFKDTNNRLYFQSGRVTALVNFQRSQTGEAIAAIGVSRVGTPSLTRSGFVGLLSESQFYQNDAELSSANYLFGRQLHLHPDGASRDRGIIIDTFKFYSVTSGALDLYEFVKLCYRNFALIDRGRIRGVSYDKTYLTEYKDLWEDPTQIG